MQENQTIQGIIMHDRSPLCFNLFNAKKLYSEMALEGKLHFKNYIQFLITLKKRDSGL